MNRKLDPRTNVPTLAALVVAFLVTLTDWASSVIPDTVPAEVVAAGHTLVVAIVAVAVGKLAQHFTWAQDSVDDILDAEAVISDAERG